MGADDQLKGTDHRLASDPTGNAAGTGAGSGNPPPLTESQFLSWKRQKDAAAAARKADASRKRAEDIAAGTVQMNGRELFLHEPWVFDNTLY